MSSRQAQLQEDTQFRLLNLLQDQPRISQRALAQALGISFGGVNYCLKALSEKGLVKMQSFRANTNKLQYAYLLTPSGVAQKVELTGRFLARKLVEYEKLRAEIESLQLQSSDITHSQPITQRDFE
jgi:EPS-associated MarR family transcriptional regulator